MQPAAWDLLPVAIQATELRSPCRAERKLAAQPKSLPMHRELLNRLSPDWLCELPSKSLSIRPVI